MPVFWDFPVKQFCPCLIMYSDTFLKYPGLQWACLAYLLDPGIFLFLFLVGVSSTFHGPNAFHIAYILQFLSTEHLPFHIEKTCHQFKNAFYEHIQLKTVIHLVVFKNIASIFMGKIIFYCYWSVYMSLEFKSIIFH